MPRSAKTLALAATLLVSAPALAGPGEAMAERPVELGAVDWSRDFDAALEASASSGKPVLVLFDEVPGCHTCVSYGTDVLTNPLLVEAAETLFHPVAVYNNVEGRDREILESFAEPTWNNPVVRVVNAQRKDIVPRVNGEYSTRGITDAMIDALERTGRDVPGYLRVLNEEANSRVMHTHHATFAMHCFWEGQAQLASLDGVIATEVGWLDGKEVVDVTFDPDRIKYTELLAKAKSMRCASTVFARTDRQFSFAKQEVGRSAVRSDEEARRVPKDDLYRMMNSAYRHVPMTPLQAQKVNAALGTGGDPASVLSPRQNELRRAIAANPNAAWGTPGRSHNFKDQMDRAEAVLATLGEG